MREPEASKSEIIRHLFELYADELYRFSYYMLGDGTEAKDIVQEVFLRVVKGFDAFQGEASHRTWIWRIARNYIVDVLRRRNKVQIQLYADLPEATVGTTLDDYPIEWESILAQLPDVQREVLLMRFHHDMDAKQIASVLGWSQTRVRNTIHRAIKTLRRTSSFGVGNFNAEQGVES